MAHKVYLVKQNSFQASHSHKGELDEVEHMHNFVYEVKLQGVTNQEGFLLDFRKVEDALIKNVNNTLNYKNLNTILGPLSTTETVAVWIYDKLKSVFGDNMHSVTVYETPDAYIIYDGQEIN